MALLHSMETLCKRLAPLGWSALLKRHGLDLGSANLAAELQRELGKIDRHVAGFEDFTSAGKRAIEPGKPAASLLYHALASARVHPTPTGAAGPVDAYATLEELDTVENFIYSLARPQLTAADAVEIVVCAYQYRPAAWTAHGVHADFAFSRTGVARVGTADAVYNAASRAFESTKPGGTLIAVRPVRYGAFLARRKHGSSLDAILGQRDQDDSDRAFYFPFHKLFSGAECLPGANLGVQFAQFHRNEKLAKIHTAGGIPVLAGFDVHKPPFTRDSGNDTQLVALQPAGASAVLRPIASRALVAVARQHNSVTNKDEIARFLVPPRAGNGSNRFAVSTLNIQSVDGITRLAPEYAHIRLRVTTGAAGAQVTDDLGNLPELEFNQILQAGGYQAAHFTDNTCDGVVAAAVTGLPLPLPSRPAYSLVTAPDFLPQVDQTEISTWVREPKPLNKRQFRQGTPWPLSEGRLPANLTLTLPGGASAAFLPDDETITAVVSPAPLSAATVLPHQKKAFVSSLPDAAANLYAPGWDVSRSTDASGHMFLAAYGLGSPFPEDAKLCAALNSFWPAAAPDVSRTFMQSDSPTAMPLLDVELGLHPAHPRVLAGAAVSKPGWDGEFGPFVETVAGQRVINFASLERSDYVSNAMEGMISSAALAQIDSDEMIARMSALQRAIATLPPATDFVNRTSLWLVSAERVADWAAEPVNGAHALHGSGYRYTLALAAAVVPVAVAGEQKRLRQVAETMFECEISSTALRFREDAGPWRTAV